MPGSELSSEITVEKAIEGSLLLSGTGCSCGQRRRKKVENIIALNCPQIIALELFHWEIRSLIKTEQLTELMD